MSQPPPPWAPPPWPPPPERRTSRWLTVGLPLGGVLLLGGCSTLVYLTVQGFAEAIGPAKEATEAYATALVEQRWDDAHAMLCDETRNATTADDLAELYGDPPLTGWSITGVNVHGSGGGTSGQATVTFTTAGGLDDAVVLALVEEDEDWRPCP